jgi:site-specific DNA-methyltransferase (adenine-specific)
MSCALDLFGHEPLPTSKWDVLFSAKSDEWPTDQAVVDDWNRRAGPFTLDACATVENAKAVRFYTLADDALGKNWLTDAGGGACWLNPPYSDIDPFIQKALAESARGLTVVACLPSRTDRPWFHAVLAAQHRCEVWFCRGRLRFGDAKHDAPFPSMVIVMRPPERRRK